MSDGPRTYNDNLLDEKGRRVVAKALDRLYAALEDGSTVSAERIMAYAQAAQAGNECLLPPDEDDESF